jgi:hypothetical protein
VEFAVEGFESAFGAVEEFSFERSVKEWLLEKSKFLLESIFDKLGTTLKIVGKFICGRSFEEFLGEVFIFWE